MSAFVTSLATRLNFNWTQMFSSLLDLHKHVSESKSAEMRCLYAWCMPTLNCNDNDYMTTSHDYMFAHACATCAQTGKKHFLTDTVRLGRSWKKGKEKNLTVPPAPGNALSMVRNTGPGTVGHLCWEWQPWFMIVLMVRDAFSFSLSAYHYCCFWLVWSQVRASIRSSSCIGQDMSRLLYVTSFRAVSLGFFFSGRRNFMLLVIGSSAMQIAWVYQRSAWTNISLLMGAYKAAIAGLLLRQVYIHVCRAVRSVNCLDLCLQGAFWTSKFPRTQSVFLAVGARFDHVAT